MRFSEAPIATTASMSATFNSNGIDVSQLWALSIQANFTGVNAASVCGLGTLKLQISNDNTQTPLSGPASGDPAALVQNWSDYSGTLASTTAVVGSSNFMWNLSSPGYRWLRLSYVAASGSGILSAQFFGKGA